MASTRSRPSGREHARPSTGGVAAEHATKIYTVAIVGIVVIVAFLTLTRPGHVVDAATQRFMLFYAGVVALMALCASVAFGLISTDRMFLHPGQRVFIQATHRAASFGSVIFLIIHIVTEILAQRVHVIDAVIPFLSPFKTFYIGLGTIAGDLMILLAITGIMRGRFNANGKAWRWRAIHYTSYVAFVFGIWHGLLAGRPAKPYYDWTYGVIIALTALGVAVRVLSNSLRPKENLSAPPVAQQASSASAPLRAAAMLAQHGSSMRGGKSIMAAATGAQTMLSAPVTATVLPALPAGAGQAAPGPAQPYYEPGYEGPPRYLGAPRNTGAMPRAATGPMPAGPIGSPRHPSGPMPTMGRRQLPSSGTGAMPRAATGAMPRHPSGPFPQGREMSGPSPRDTTGQYPAPPQSWTDPMPRATGSMPRADDGWDPRPPRGAAPRGPAGPPRGGTGPSPVWPESGQRPATGPMPYDGGQPDYQEWPPDYQEWPEGSYDQGWQEDQGWLEASHDDGRYQEQPPWDGYLPEAEPDPRYREPGPGMPGYRGAREHRYGGDRY